MGLRYDKPHLTYADQLQRLMSRGLTCADEHRAKAVLRAAGYYRLSAYVYPFRELLGDDDERSSPFHFRSDTIRVGTTFADIEQLWRFDRSLRLAWFDALETIEVGVRNQIAYVLGERDTFGHVNRASLDEEACQAPVGPERTEAFALWNAKYDALRSKAMFEDYMKHNLHKYEGALPVWIAVEFFDFGAVARLFRLLRREHQNSISRALGIRNGRHLASTLQQLNYVRNLCAHHARLWNRTLTMRTAASPRAALPEVLAHTAALENREKVYIPLAMTAHLAHELDPASNWPSRLRTVLRKFPDIATVSPEGDMGFPLDWAEQPLWKSHERR